MATLNWVIIVEFRVIEKEFRHQFVLKYLDKLIYRLN